MLTLLLPRQWQNKATFLLRQGWNRCPTVAMKPCTEKHDESAETWGSIEPQAYVTSAGSANLLKSAIKAMPTCSQRPFSVSLETESLRSQLYAQRIYSDRDSFISVDRSDLTRGVRYFIIRRALNQYLKLPAQSIARTLQLCFVPGYTPIVTHMN